MINYQDRWAVVTGADRGMSLGLTGRNGAQVDQAAQQIRQAAVERPQHKQSEGKS